MSDLRHLPVGTRVRVGFALIYEKVPGGMWRSRRLKALHNWITDEQLVELLVGKRKEAEEIRARAEAQDRSALDRTITGKAGHGR
ncbi:hypothetical protein AB0N24_18610 [Arthrobacter sp. NPDC093128]|uniref:hypothetical protein n=1 Tax=Arthrobacter sp. NPDC093128 TaxID=3154979 RepID=UPI00343F496E